MMDTVVVAPTTESVGSSSLVGVSWPAIVAGAVGIYLGTRGNVQRGGDTMSVCVGNSCLGN